MAYVEINNFYLLFRCFTDVCIDTYVSRYFYININMYLDFRRYVLIYYEYV